MASDQSKKTQLERQTHVIELTSGVQTDQFAESVPILDSNNTEVLPGKSGLFNRRGHARWTKYAPKTDPVGRIALVVDSQPPNLSDGTWLISAVDTSVPTNPIVYLQPFKPRTNLSNDTLVSRVYFDKAAYFSDYTSPIVLTITRTGALDREITVDWATENGTALAGIDYTAATGSVTFQPGDTDKTVSIVIVGTQGADAKAFSVKILKASTGGQVTSPSIATVTLAGEETIPPEILDGTGLYVVASRTLTSPTNAGVLSEEFPTRIVYAALWCIDLSATVSERVGLYIMSLPLSVGWTDQGTGGFSPINDGLGHTAMVGTGSAAFTYTNGANWYGRFLARFTASLSAMKLGGPTYKTSPPTYYTAAAVASSPNSLTSKVIGSQNNPDHFYNGKGTICYRDPVSGDVYSISRNFIYKGSDQNAVPLPAGCEGVWNDVAAGEVVIGNIGSGTTEVFPAESGKIWQVRCAYVTAAGTRHAFLCKITLATGALDKAIQLPTSTDKGSVHLVLMDDGTPMIFTRDHLNADGKGQWVLGDGDVWTRLYSAAPLLRRISHIHNVGDNKVVYIPEGTNRLALGQLSKTLHLTKILDFDEFTVSDDQPGPTWLTPNKVFAMNLSTNPQTYGIFNIATGALLESGVFNDAYGGGGDSNPLSYKTQIGSPIIAPIPVKKAFY